jgi:hypothetical protein
MSLCLKNLSVSYFLCRLAPPNFWLALMSLIILKKCINYSLVNFLATTEQKEKNLKNLWKKVKKTQRAHFLYWNPYSLEVFNQQLPNLGQERFLKFEEFRLHQLRRKVKKSPNFSKSAYIGFDVRQSRINHREKGQLPGAPELMETPKKQKNPKFNLACVKTLKRQISHFRKSQHLRAVCRLSANFVIHITFFPFNLNTFPFKVKVF